jgi:hypothetical protein
MQLKTVKEVKAELKRIRKRQDTHQYNATIDREKNKMRSLLWKLLKQTPYSRKAQKGEKTPKPRRTPRSTGKTKSSSSYT